MRTRKLKGGTCCAYEHHSLQCSKHVEKSHGIDSWQIDSTHKLHIDHHAYKHMDDVLGVDTCIDKKLFKDFILKHIFNSSYYWCEKNSLYYTFISDTFDATKFLTKKHYISAIFILSSGNICDIKFEITINNIIIHVVKLINSSSFNKKNPPNFSATSLYKNKKENYTLSKKAEVEKVEVEEPDEIFIDRLVERLKIELNKKISTAKITKQKDRVASMTKIRNTINNLDLNFLLKILNPKEQKDIERLIRIIKHKSDIEKQEEADIAEFDAREKIEPREDFLFRINKSIKKSLNLKGLGEHTDLDIPFIEKHDLLDSPDLKRLKQIVKIKLAEPIVIEPVKNLEGAEETIERIEDDAPAADEKLIKPGDTVSVIDKGKEKKGKVVKFLNGKYQINFGDNGIFKKYSPEFISKGGTRHKRTKYSKRTSKFR